MLIKRVGFIAAVLLLTLADASICKSDTVSEARKAIQAAYDKEAKAASKLDVKGMYAAHSPSFVFLVGGTKEPLHTRQERDEVNFRHIKSTKTKYVIRKMTVKAKVATVLCAVHINVIFFHPDTHKPMSPDVIDATQQDTWVKSEKGWLLTVTKPLTEK
jgi:hypothetical protein